MKNSNDKLIGQMTKQEFIEALQESYAQKEKARLTKANKDLSAKVAWQ